MKNKYVAFVVEENGNKYYTKYNNKLENLIDWKIKNLTNSNNITLYEINEFDYSFVKKIISYIDNFNFEFINTGSLNDKDDNLKSVALITNEDLLKNKKHTRYLKV